MASLATLPESAHLLIPATAEIAEIAETRAAVEEAAAIVVESQVTLQGIINIVFHNIRSQNKQRLLST